MPRAPIGWLHALLALALGACSEPPHNDRIAHEWSDTAPTIYPDAEGSAVEGVATGRVVVLRNERRRVSQEPKQETTGPSAFRGYSIYDRTGRLVYQCAECVDDARDLPPGQYVAVADLEYGLLDHEEKQVQFVVAPGRTTVLDFAHSRERPVPQGAKPQPGTPQPGTGHSR